MNSLIPPNNTALSTRTSVSSGRRLLNAGMAAALAGIVSFASIGHAQENKPAAAPTSTAPTAEHHHDRHHRDFRHGRMDPAKAEKGMEHRINRMLDNVKATAEQKAKVTAIAKAAFDELRPLQEKSRVNRQAQFKLLAQAKIDVAALEKLRQENLALDDQRSHLINSAFIEAAVVLTPAQRMELAKHMQERHDHKMQHGHKKGGMDHQPPK